jgi:hypothetical protein
VPYLGYDRCGLAVLLGALHELRNERFRTEHPSRWSTEALDRHRRAVASIGAFAEPIGAILHGDPLGRYRGVCLDPRDLGQWALHRGGAWATVTDAAIVLGGPQQDFVAVNARLLAREMTPDGLRRLLRGDGSGALSFVRYLGTIRNEPAARTAFLDTLGPAGFSALLDVANRGFARCHQTLGRELPAAERADEVLSGLGGLWATSRASGSHRDDAWTGAALCGSLYTAGRLLEVAAQTPGALATDELAAWARSTWQHVLTALGTDRAPWPSLVGDHVLGALAQDGRAARSFLVGLADDGPALAALLANVASSPTSSRRLLLASSDPRTLQTPHDDAELARSMQAVVRTAGHLLDTGAVTFPHFSPDGTVDATGYGPILPTDVGLYVGRYVDRLIDPCDAARTGACPIASRTWPGWREREVLRLLDQLVEDPRTAAQLEDATIAGFLHRVGTLDLTNGRSDQALEQAAFTVAAVQAVIRDHGLERTIGDERRFGQLVAGADLVVTVAGMAGAAPVTAASRGWAWFSRGGGISGLPTPGELLLSPFRPRSIRDALSQSRATQALDSAVLKGAVASIAFAELQRSGQLAGPVPAVTGDQDDQIEQLVTATRPGDNANSAGNAYLDDIHQWLDGNRDAPAGQVIEHLLDSVGDAAAQGANWVS